MHSARQEHSSDLVPTPVVSGEFPGLRAHAEAVRRQEIDELLADIRHATGHLATRVTLLPDGSYELQALPPEPGEEPSFEVKDLTNDPEGLTAWVDQRGGWQEYAEQATRPVPEEVFRRGAQIEADALLFADGLGPGPLAQAVSTPLIKASQDITEVARRAEAGQTDITPEEVARAQRDLFFLVQATLGALGVRDFQAGIEESLTFVYFKDRKPTGRGSCSFTYDVVSETWEFEGDYEGKTPEELDLLGLEGFVYAGELEIVADPDKRISISYRPEQASARGHHRTEDVAKRGGKLVSHEFDDLNLRIDLDPKSPSGLALDVGRSKFDASDVFLRDADLLGRVMTEANPETGSHVYEGFSAEMLPQFKPMAEALIVRLTLGFQEHEAALSDEAASRR